MNVVTIHLMRRGFDKCQRLSGVSWLSKRPMLKFNFLTEVLSVFTVFIRLEDMKGTVEAEGFLRSRVTLW